VRRKVENEWGRKVRREVGKQWGRKVEGNGE
jgi:hypothetical protein